jgi:predicted enzyme related to lactoylglutathione lyase
VYEKLSCKFSAKAESINIKYVHVDITGRLINLFPLISTSVSHKTSSHMEDKQPTRGNGKICYLEIPAIDIETSSNFYNKSFGWRLRKDNHGSVAFDDGVGEVSGMWVLDKKPMTEAGIIISIMVDDIEATKRLVIENGGKIVFNMQMDSGEVIAHFTDPAGNIMSLYQSSK